MGSSYALPLFALIGGGLMCAVFAFTSGLSPWHADYTVSGWAGIIGAVWCWYPFHLKFSESRGSLLHPNWCHYKIGLQAAFRGIRDVLEGTVVNTGDQWHIESNTNERTMKAQIQWFVQESSYDPGAIANINVNTHSVKRFMQLTVQFHENQDDTTAIAFDFYPLFDGKNLFPCDAVVKRFYAAVDRKLGIGSVQDSGPTPFIAAPPIGLIAITFIAEVFLFQRIWSWITG